MDIPFIEGTGFYMRELRASDVEGDWYSWFNNSKVTVYQNKKIFPNTREKQKEYFEKIQNSCTDVVLALIDVQTDKHIGNVGLHHIDWVHRSAELGIVIGDSDFWGKKYGRQAWKMITDYGFKTLNLHRICAIVMVENASSVKCAEAAGFIREGEIKDYFYKNGSYHSVYYYNIINR